MKKGLLIYQKIIFIQFISILIVTSIFGSFLYKENMNKELKELNLQTTRLKHRLSNNLSVALWNLDYNSCNKLLSEEMVDKYVSALVVYQENEEMYMGKIKSGNKIENIDDINKYKEKLKNSYSVIKEPIVFIENENKNNLGEVVIYTTDKYIKELLSSFILRSVIQTILLVVILSAITYFILNLFLNKPLKSFKNIFRKGMSGDLNIRYPVIKNKRDEINELGLFFNKFTDEVKKIITEVVDTSNELGISSEQLSATLTAFSDHSQSQAASSEEITATMEEINAGVDNVSENSSFQFDKLSNFIESMKELSDMIKSMAKGITETQENSKQISAMAKAGNESLSMMDMIMSKITESSNKVSEIVEIIVTISDRINLLSLNAAIEAARAGEAGKGFAVVADEISKLADQTATSINDIDSLIKKNKEEIATGMKNVVDTVDNIGSVIEGVESINNKMNVLFSDMKKQQSMNELVNNSIDEVRLRSDEVRSATKEQRTAVSEVMKSITNINELVQAGASGAEEMTANATRLATVADNLKSKVSFFKI